MLAAATAICFILRPLVPTDTHVPLIYVLAVLCVSRLTEGYFYGVLASMVAVVGVNYIFTYPYFQVDFTVTGYPLTFIVMLTVSISVSALMTQIKMQEHVRLKAEKERMRANLLRAVSHDIRTPLTSIEGAAAGIIDNKDVLTEEQKEELLLNIKEEAQWMVRMVENLLSITRMNDEGTRLTTHEELAEEIVSSAVVKFSKRFPDIKVEVDIPEEVVIVPMDPILIRQVIVNIMENAVIHGGSTTQVKVTISANETEAIFSIEDNGKGIDGKILPMLFTGQISHREGEMYDNKRSMGIGLSVCKSIIDAHRGKVWAVRIKMMAGSERFYLHYRLRRKNRMEIKDRVLIVEDDKNIRKFIQTILEANDYDVIATETGKEAYSLITSRCPDVVILDLGLPDMDGMKILKEVRAWSNMPIIVVSARDHEKDKVEALDMGADDYITKPFGTSELLARIRAAIRHFRGTSKNQGERQKVTFLNGKLVIDYDKHRVYVEEQDAGLTQNEFRLLSLLGKYAGKVLTYDYMMKEIWGPNMKGDNRILRVNMANIRRKIEKNPGQPQFIFTEVGVGYRIIETDS